MFYKLQIMACSIIIATLLIAGCGSSKDDSQYVDIDSYDVAMEKLQNSQLTCQGNCVPGVGLLIALTRESENSTLIQRCTIFQVAPKLMITNSHCIPQDLRVERASCNDRLHVFVPVNAQGNIIHTKCARVLSAMQITSDGSGVPDFRVPDFALIELISELPQSSNLPLAESVTSRVRSFHLEAKAVVVDPLQSESSYSGLQKSTFCGITSPSFNRSERFVLQTPSCKIINGNSGSPLLNTENQVIGVIFASTRSSTDAWSHDLSCISSTHFPSLNRRSAQSGTL